MDGSETLHCRISGWVTSHSEHRFDVVNQCLEFGVTYMLGFAHAGLRFLPKSNLVQTIHLVVRAPCRTHELKRSLTHVKILSSMSSEFRGFGKTPNDSACTRLMYHSLIQRVEAGHYTEEERPD